MISPLVSVKMITFNHCMYIGRAIEGILMQKTTFPFELVIGDDCSTDGTTDIISGYAEKYPGIIRHIKREKNLGAKENARDLNRYLRGEYVAFCEGDDYWTDSCKLQKQADFLEGHPEYSMCFHPVEVIREDGRSTGLFRNLEEREYSPSEILERWTIPTCSVMFRGRYYPEFYYHPHYLFTDIALFLTLAKFGRLWCMKETMAVYSRHQGGVTQKKIPYERRLAHFAALESQFGSNFSKQLRRLRSNIFYSEARERARRFSPLAALFFARAIISDPGFLYRKIFRK